MSWRFEQSTGHLYLNDQFVASGYSGFPPYTNKPGAEQIKNFGPIPKGRYHIGSPYDSPNVGPFALPLEASPETMTFNRGDFRIHGDSRIDPGSASHGCLIFPRQVREMIAKSEDKTLEVFDLENSP